MGAAFDEEVDLLVFGAGAGGMTAALSGAIAGLKVLLCEKTDMVGGTTSTSGGTTWVPGTSLARAAGLDDSAEDAARFLQHVVGNRGGDTVRAAFLASGDAAISDLVAHSEVRFAPAAAHPDYLDGPGSGYGGRALSPVEFDGRLLGNDFARVRPPHAVFMGLGGMMVGRAELGALLKPFASLANFKTTMRVVLPYFRDRLRHKRGTRLLMGNALVGRLFYSLRKRGVPIWFDSPLSDFIRDETGGVIGAVVTTANGPRRVRARRGVVLATGGIGWNKDLRARLFPSQIAKVSQAAPGDTGDGVSMAEARLGAAVDNGCDSAGLWMPCSMLKRSDGSTGIWPHILLDRAKPGLIAVGADGRRFVNESDSYHDFCMGMLRAGLSEAWLVVDDPFIRTYGLGLVLPGGRGLGSLLRKGYLTKAATLAELAQRIGVDATGLAESVAANNRFAASGVDADFGRGTSVMNRFNGDPGIQGNPCLGPLNKAPFYALKVVPVDLAGSGGLSITPDGAVLDQAGAPIPGLFACGNDATSMFRGTYPGPGTTIGPAMVMGWRIARHLAA
ncbi:FAD-binding protein [Gemmobacter serpentinus]|uniref:FAD-binding protein n=1 Tax=Gemmobacter serpentinus TaxID=2652247 RepID=UPI00124F116B|nr:FAD-binding protein [Gemmobacter serpentinus]